MNYFYWQVLSFFTKITKQWATSKNRIRTPTLKLRRNGPSENRTCWKILTVRPKSVAICLVIWKIMLQWFMFFEKSRGVQDIVFVQITFEKCTTNLYFADDESRINRQFVAFISMKSFHMFMYFYAASFSIKVGLYEANNIFLSQALDVFSQNCCFWKFNKNKG